jgi:hypothetical protein
MSRLTAAALRRSARGVRGIYRKAEADARYAERLAAAVRNTDLDALDRLFRQATSGFNETGANGSAFTIGFAAAAPASEILHAASIRGGRRFTAARLRSLSFRILPLVRSIADKCTCAEALVRAARARDNARLRRLIAPRIRRGGLVSVQGDAKSIVMRIRVADGSVFLVQWFVL